MQRNQQVVTEGKLQPLQHVLSTRFLHNALKLRSYSFYKTRKQFLGKASLGSCILGLFKFYYYFFFSVKFCIWEIYFKTRNYFFPFFAAGRSHEYSFWCNAAESCPREFFPRSYILHLWIEWKKRGARAGGSRSRRRVSWPPLVIELWRVGGIKQGEVSALTLLLLFFFLSSRIHRNGINTRHQLCSRSAFLNMKLTSRSLWINYGGVFCMFFINYLYIQFE